MKNVNPELKKYIEDSIFPEYNKNEPGHGIQHINYVIDRSLKFAESLDVDINMVYAIAAYHDIGHHIDYKNHEKVSAEILEKDQELRSFFTEEQIKTMADAVYDHRSSMDGIPRTIYGKIVSQNDRDTNLEMPFKRTYAYRTEHHIGNSLEEIIEESRKHLLGKFGPNGTAREKVFFDDPALEKFFTDITNYANNKEEFRQEFLRVNNIKQEG